LATCGLLIRGYGKIGQLPLPDQALSASFSGRGGKGAHIAGSVDIERYTGQGKYHAGLPRGLSGGMVRFETVVAEAGGK
jgi:hypothetical protein